MKKIYIIAVIASVIAGIALFNFLLDVEKESKVNYTEVVVAIADIEAQTAITAEMVMVKNVPAEGVHSLASKKVEDVLGMITKEKILLGEQIIVAKLQKVGESAAGLSYAIPENMRAITISVDGISGVAGFVSPGDRVDIIGTIMQQVGQESIQTSNLFLQNIKVLAVGDVLKKKPAEGGEISPTAAYSSITLLLSPEDSVRLNLVATTGAMRLLLRGATDEVIADVEPKTAKNVIE